MDVELDPAVLGGIEVPHALDLVEEGIVNGQQGRKPRPEGR
jgi:hypothetical protein